MQSRFIGRTVAGALAAGLLAGLFPANAHAAPTVSLLSVKPSVIVGESLSARGKVSAAGVNNTAVEAWTGSKWSTSQAGRTAANGQFTLPITYGRTTVGNTRFRLRVTVAGQARYSREFTITRKATNPVVLSAAPSATVGKTVTARAKVSNLGAGRRVYSQFLVGGTWRTSQVAVTNGAGETRITLSYGQSKAGKYTWRLVSTNPYGITSTSKTFVLQRTSAVAAKPATPKPVARSYSNCAALTQVYPHGVGRSGAQNLNWSGQLTRQVPFTANTAVYNANTHLDGDGDGIACER